MIKIFVITDPFSIHLKTDLILQKTHYLEA